MSVEFKDDQLAIAVLREICGEQNQTQSSIAKALDVPARSVDSKLQMLRKRELARYVAEQRKWVAFDHAHYVLKAIDALSQSDVVDSEKVDEDGVESKSEVSESVPTEMEKKENTMLEENTKVEKLNVDEVDSAIAKARKDADTEPKHGRKRLTDEEKAAKKAAEEAERAERKAQREAARAEKLAAKQAATPHMSKVEKAAARLPALSEQAQLLFDHLVVNLSSTDITTIVAHLQHYNRVKATERALEAQVEVGDTVQVVSGEARYIGLTGTVNKTQRIRCYVNVNLPDGSTKEVYLFTSDVQKLESEEAVETESEEQLAANS